jgi:hypothetical protein
MACFSRSKLDNRYVATFRAATVGTVSVLELRGEGSGFTYEFYKKGCQEKKFPPRPDGEKILSRDPAHCL